MKKITFAALALAVSAGSAIAADLPSRKAPVLVPPPPMWTGFYAGLNAGYDFGTNSNVGVQNLGAPWTNTVAFGPPLNTPAGTGVISGRGPVSMDAWASNTQSGFIGGGQIGYNYQYGSNFLLGFEADIQGANIRGVSRSGGASAGASERVNPINGAPLNVGSTNNAVGSSVVQGGVDWLGTVRGRVGYLWTPTLLLYGTGGFAYGGAYANVAQTAIENHFSRVVFVNGVPQANTGRYEGTAAWLGGGRQKQILTGWTAGGGAEWLFAPNWSVKAEALYWNLGRMNVQTLTYSASPNAAAINNNIGWGRASVSYQGVQVKVGLNYHFTWATGPIVASY